MSRKKDKSPRPGESGAPFEVVRAEADFLIINKAPGIAFHTTESGNKPGILQLVRAAEERGELESGERLYPVHRLDAVTSGLLVFARGRKNANALSNEFRHNRVEKYYVALSDRRPQKKQGRVSGDMERGRRGTWILNRAHANPAVTQFFSKSVNGSRPGLRLFILRPRTGRTHQIRVAMKSLSAPILGDPLYGRYDLARQEDRTYLHAYALRFELAGQEIKVLCPPAPGFEFSGEEFRQAFQEYKNPFALPWPGSNSKSNSEIPDPSESESESKSELGPRSGPRSSSHKSSPSHPYRKSKKRGGKSGPGK